MRRFFIRLLISESDDALDDHVGGDTGLGLPGLIAIE